MPFLKGLQTVCPSILPCKPPFWEFLGGFPGSGPAKGVQKRGVFGGFLAIFGGFSRFEPS
jgi:hypothetical protein